MKKQLNKILFLIIGVLFLFTNCQKDDFETTKIDQQSKIIYKKLAFRDLHSISSKTLKELENTISTSRKYFLERGINTDNKYIIDSSNVIYIRDQSGYSSYTFAIQPESNSTTLQNIIISNYTDGTSSTFLAEYDLNKNINEIQNEQIYNAINKSSYFNLKNSNLYSNRIDVGQAGELCVDIGYYQTVDKCEGELVTPGENPGCFNSDGTHATQQVFILVASACSNSGGNGNGNSNGTGNGMGSNNGSSGHSGGNSGSTGTTPSTPNNPGNGSGLTDNNGNLITSPLIPLSGHTSFLLTLTTAHKSWLNNTNNLEDKNNIFDYLSEQNYSNESLIYIRAMLDEIINNSNNNNNNDWLSTIVLLNNSGPKITNILQYLECINLNQSAVFTMYVDQPTQNQSDSWSGTPTDPNVGHTFIAIKQNNIRRVLGFYPSSGVNPFTNPSTSSSLIDDSGHLFHTSISVSISPAKLQTIIAYISNYPSTYNLNTYNCTDFGLSLSKLAGINIPSAKGTWPGGSGNNPGQLGQNIRKIPLPTGSSLKNTTGGNSPLNQGNCN